MLQTSACTIYFFFFNDTATTEIYTLSLHDALPISDGQSSVITRSRQSLGTLGYGAPEQFEDAKRTDHRSEEHTSELQSLAYLVCRLLLEKKKHMTHSDRDSHLCAGSTMQSLRHTAE